MTQLRSVGIRGTGSFVPERILSNADLERLVDTSDEWITTRTGIKERRIIADGETTSDLAFRAAEKAIEAAGVGVADIDLVIVGTVTGDYQFPSTACRVQSRLGLPNAGSFDLSAACSGFLYAITTGAQFVASGAARNVLVIGAEALSRIVDYDDRTSCILFGDGAGAVVLSSEFERGEILPSSTLHANGDGYDIMWIEAGGSAQELTAQAIEEKKHLMRIRGREVYKFAVNKFVELVTHQIEQHPELELGMVIPHQVNMRIIESARERLGLESEQVFVNIETHGNTSAASIPIALDQAVRGGALDSHQGKLIPFCAFGAGLTWASAAMRW